MAVGACEAGGGPWRHTLTCFGERGWGTATHVRFGRVADICSGEISACAARVIDRPATANK